VAATKLIENKKISSPSLAFTPSSSCHLLPDIVRTHLKIVFWPNIFVGASFQILDIQQYACGFKLGPAAILNQNPIFETGSN
jgi:hypothetical protein